MPPTTLPVTLPDVEAARELLTGVVRPTPLEYSRALAELVGGPVHLKCENLQRAGSFKIRGAYTRIARLSEQEKARGVVAASAGNHAQGVALAARLLGLRATVYMPVGAALPKIRATEGYGAHVVLQGSTVDEALVSAREHAEATGAVLIHPFDHVDIVAGQGTVGLEILEECPDVRTVVVCTGGGGLLAGIATAVRALRPDVRVVGVQAGQAAAWPASLAAGHPVPLERMSTMADGIAVGRPGDVPFAVVRELVDDIRTVGEEAISQALLHLLERAKLVVEPAGAVGVAALMAEPGAFEPPVVVVLSGGNIDPLLLLRVIRHGMASAGRYLSLRVRVADRPGSLAGLLAVLADADANVLEVEHVRTGAALSVDEVEIGLQLETRGPEHCDAVLDRLRSEGYPVTSA
ncbi:threonine ammonia-lyase [Quadrisphaera sp. GCM10027208]|uniref:threonine ammonia-lyase n=1 Tax=Quadrisphaera sp. GCM10027208 TaxID=3273423 RepID=UPI00360789A0